MNNMSSNQKMLLSFVAGLIVGVGGAWLWLERGGNSLLESSPKDGETAQSEEMEEGTVPEGAGVAGVSGSAAEGIPATGETAVTVADQPAGAVVVVTNVMLPQGGWVVVHEEQNGAPSWVLGARRFPAGVTAMGEVELLRGTTAGGTYYAMLHADNGNGTFDLSDDKPLLGEDGKFIMGMFEAQ